MKISNIGKNMPGISKSTDSADVEKNLTAAAKKGVTDSKELKDSAKVNLSTQAQGFQKAKAIASNDSIDHNKVARLQKLIDEGNYKVDAEAVANRLVDEHLIMND